MANKLDPRINAYRDDLADIRLQEHIEARRFVSGSPARIIAPITNVYGKAEPGPLVTQALFGETLHIFETKNGFHWVQLDADNYVGYVAEQDVDHGAAVATHRINVPLAHVYAKADIKSQPLELLPLGARVQAVGSNSDEWHSLSRGGFIKTSAVRDVAYPDLAVAAMQFLHAPYLWGGRTALGIDCSGLVQVAMNMLGQTCPRDSDQQEAFLGEKISEKKLQRNDLVFFKGHVGIMWNDTDLLHANAHAMATTLEPLADVTQRAAITSCRRLKR